MMPMVNLPVMEIYEQSGAYLRVRVVMQDNTSCFDGHFPGLPILPGVMQLHWVVLLAKQHWYPQGQFSSVSRIKFQCPIQPQDVLDIELTHKAGGKFNYSYTSNDRVMSSGSFELTDV